MVNNSTTKWSVQQCSVCGRFLGTCSQIDGCIDQEHSCLPHLDSATCVWHALISPLVDPPQSNGGSGYKGKNQLSAAQRQQSISSPQSPRKSQNANDESSGAIIFMSEETLTCIGVTESSLMSLDDKVVARISINSQLAPFHIQLMPKFLTLADGLFGTFTEHQHLIRIKRVKLDLLNDVSNVHLIPSSPLNFAVISNEASSPRTNGTNNGNSTDQSKKESMEQIIQLAKMNLTANFFHQNQPILISNGQALSFQVNVRVPLLEEFDMQDESDHIFVRGFAKNNRSKLDDKMARLSISPGSEKVSLAYSEKTVYRLSRERDAKVVLRDCSLLDPDLPGETFQALCGPILFEKLIAFFRAQILSSGDLIRMGFRPPRGLLLHGTAGTGKSALCAYLADLADTNPVVITAERVFSRFYGDCEATLRGLFESAIRSAPSTIIIDDIDVFCAKGEAERKLVACLNSLLDMVHRLPASVRLFVIAATSKLESIDSSLRRYGRLDHEFELLPPDRECRRAIIEQLLSRADHLLNVMDFDQIAEMTSSFVAADIRALCTEAALHCSMKHRKTDEAAIAQHGRPQTPLLNSSCASLVPQGSNVAQICFDDFVTVFSRVRPTARRDICVEVPRVRWTDIGGLEDVKNRLRQSVEWPMKHSNALIRLGLKPPKGALLYGPPGCSKTLIARALATESGLAFLSIKGPELFNKWLGESERAVRQLFRRARQAAPSIIFFDEVDAIAPARSGGPSSGAQSSHSASERVVAQLLTELDGIQDLDRVFVLAATNRPDVLDTAVIRPGRLDRLIYVPLPDEATRRQILQLQFAHTPIKSGHGPEYDAFVHQLARRTEGFTGAEVVSLVQEAAFHALDKSSFRATDVHEADFDYAFTVVKPRTDMRMLESYEEFALSH